MIRFPLKLAELEPEVRDRTHRSTNHWWTSLDHFARSSWQVLIAALQLQVLLKMTVDRQSTSSLRQDG
ncbi:hypothetical protein [Endozoicomonas euniceicola]|uniref:Uncharacterized protein n=1 Tax=Endozoicomonas euniceicola TaxID=1234143 RepID=A0ABY6GSH4_9GAMM|nr:hypothetical protein [Endozoicomonas euniceicola]UYM15713.1 hypothetical protein NX720_23265 [Endozoicomonas euniceicola]